MTQANACYTEAMDDCNHSWMKKGSILSLVETLDDWLGPTLAIVRCEYCRQPALINLVAWQGAQLRTRIYGVRLLTPEVTDTYLANISRDYCDLTRKTSETEALIQTADKKANLLLTSVPELAVESITSGHHDAPFREWQAVKTEDFDHWYEILRQDEKK